MIKNDKIVKKLFLVLFIICISIVGALIWINGGYEKGGLLDFGKSYDISCEILDNNTETIWYAEEIGNYVIKSVEADIYFHVGAPKTKWKHCMIKLSNLSREYVIWEIELLNPKGKTLCKKNYILREGRNWIKVSANGKVKSMRIGIYNQNQPWYTFKIDSIILKQKDISFEKILEKTVVLMLVCLVLYLLLGAIKRLDWYFIIEILQNAYIRLGDFVGSYLASVLKENIRKKLMVLCFMFLFLLSIVMNVVSGECYDVTGHYWIYGYGILLIFVGILSWNKPLHKLDWKNGICLAWLLLWIVISISDLLVPKSFAYVGYVMVICGGFAFFVWSNEKCFQCILRSMIKALEYTLLPILFYCMVFRQKKEGVLYNGCFLQHESMAMYFLAILIAFLVEWHYLFKKEQLYVKKMILCGTGMLVSASMLYYSRTKYCMFAAITAIVVWGICQMIQLRKYKRKNSELFIIAGMILMLAIPSILIVKYTVESLPQKLGTDMVYTNEVLESAIVSDVLPEGIMPNDEEYRKNIWSSYIQKINFIGNKDNLQEKETYLNPANGILQMAHRYGIFVLIPYLAILLLSVYSAMKERNFVWVLTVLIFFIVLFGENIEMPFTQPLWFLFYLGIGQFLGNREKEDMRLEITYENCD